MPKKVVPINLVFKYIARYDLVSKIISSCTINNCNAYKNNEIKYLQMLKNKMKANCPSYNFFNKGKGRKKAEKQCENKRPSAKGQFFTKRLLAHQIEKIGFKKKDPKPSVTLCSKYY